MHTAIKLLIGITTIGSVTGGSLALSNYLLRENIENKLIKAGFKKLEKTSAEWTNIFASYQTVSKKTEKSNLKFFGSDITTKEELQKRCEEILNKNSSENDNNNNYLGKAKKWCIVPITVADSLLGKIILKTDNNKDAQEDQESWNEKIKNYTKSGKNNEVRGLTFSGNTPITQPTKDSRDLIRNKCKELNGKKNYEDDYELSLEESKIWCTK